MSMVTYVCPKCGFEIEQPKHSDDQFVGHECSKASPIGKLVKLKEKTNA